MNAADQTAAGKSAMDQPVAEKATSEKTGQEPKEQGKKKKNPMAVVGIVFALVSFSVIFGSMLIFMRHREPTSEKGQSGPDSLTVTGLGEDSASVSSDSLMMVISQDSLIPAAADSQEVAVGDSNAGSILDSSRIQDMFEYLRAKNELVQQQGRLQRMVVVEGENQQMTQELDSLKKEIEKQKKRMEFLEKTLPESLAIYLSKNQGTKSSEQARNVAVKTSSERPSSIAGAGIDSTDAAHALGIRKLAKLYEAMKPQEAAPIIAKLEEDDIVDVLLRMRQRQAAKIMGYLEPNLAVKISKRISRPKPITG